MKSWETLALKEFVREEEPFGGNTEEKPEGCEVPDVNSVECGWGSDQHSRGPESLLYVADGHWGPQQEQYQ